MIYKHIIIHNVILFRNIKKKFKFQEGIQSKSIIY